MIVDGPAGLESWLRPETWILDGSGQDPVWPERACDAGDTRDCIFIVDSAVPHLVVVYGIETGPATYTLTATAGGEGTSIDPVMLELGVPYAGGVGPRQYSYYTFRTATAGSYVIDVDTATSVELE